MLFGISHRTNYRYEVPVISFIHTIRLTPQSFSGQKVIDWRIDLAMDGSIRENRDSFGNITHNLYGKNVYEIDLLVEGRVDVTDMGGVVSGLDDPLPPEFYLNATSLTGASQEIIDYAHGCQASNDLETAHRLAASLCNDIIYDRHVTNVETTAAQSFSLRRGVTQDFTHIFIAMCRALGIPARYVSGYFCTLEDQHSANAWSEAYIDGLGWVAFDPRRGICTTARHIRVATGLDYGGAAPITGARSGGGKSEALTVSVSFSFPDAAHIRALHDKMLKDLATLDAMLEPDPEPAGIGHNNPPEELDGCEDVESHPDSLARDVSELMSQPVLPVTVDDKLLKKAERLASTAQKLQQYLAAKGDVFLSEAVKSAGGEFGKWVVRAIPISIVIGILFQASDSVAAWLQAIRQFFTQ